MSKITRSLAVIGAMVGLAAPAPPIELQSRYSTSTHWLGGNTRRRRWARDNLPRGYPGAKLARKAMLGQLTLRR